MRIFRLAALGAIMFYGVCHGAEPGGRAVASRSPDRQAPHAHAVTKQFAILMGKLEVQGSTYVDGVALRLADGAGAVLTEHPLDACARLAVVAEGNLDFDTAKFGDKPALLLVRNAEHPEGAILLIEPNVTSTLEGSFPGLVTDGDALVASGDVGDAGWGSIDPTEYGAEKAPRVHLDVRLPYASIDTSDPVSADSSQAAKWLRSVFTSRTQSRNR